MRTKSKLAGLSLVLGVSGMVLALSREPGLLLLAGFLGFLAITTGALALWFIRQARAAQRGRGAALAGFLAGVATTVFSLAALMFMVGQRISRQTPGWPPIVQQLVPWHPMPDKPATNFTSNLPIVVLDTSGDSVEKETKTFVRATLLEVENGRASMFSRADYDGYALLHLHGSSSLRLPKQSFTLQTVDRQTNQLKTSLLGLPKEDDWILYAPYEDKTMIRDVLAYELAGRTGRYAPRTRYVEVFLRHSPRSLSMRDYAGVYVLVEKIKRGKERVNLAKLERSSRAEPDISGGYIIKRDHSERQAARFYTSRTGPYFYVYPGSVDISEEQKTWLQHYLTTFESALHSEGFADPERGYAAYLDVDSFIDAHWLVEASRNVDGFRYSAFLTKDRGGKLKPEPPWDWNRSFGNANYYDGWRVQGWHWTHLRPSELSWYQRLRQDPTFVRRCAARWAELRRDTFDPQRICARIDELATQLEEAQQRNYQRWPILGEQVTCNHYVGSSYADEVRWLKRWIVGRISWIDSQVTPER